MKKIRKIAVAVLALLLLTALLLVSVPVPLLSMLSVPEGESWECEVMQPGSGITVLDADRTVGGCDDRWLGVFDPRGRDDRDA